MNWTIKDLERSAVAGINQHLFEKAPVKKPVNEKYSKEKYWINYRLQEFAKENGFDLMPEHRFHEKRKWRFDWAIPEIMTAWEYEGIFSKKSRHTTQKGFTGDAEKYNAAQSLGWKVMRYTAINYMDLVIDLNNYKQPHHMNKPAMTAPAIAAEGIDDYILENGNTISKDSYNAMWLPKKTDIMPSAYQNIGRQIPNELKNKKS